MRPAVKIIIMLLIAVLLAPVPARASWWGGGDEQKGLDLESGYDANTVTTVAGRIVALYLDGPQPLAQVELAAGAGSVMVVLGPRNYWAEQGIVLELGKRLTVRGSKAQGKDGVVYLLAQWLIQEDRGQEITLRSDSGRPAWGGFGSRGGGQHGTRSGAGRHSPGRIGGGRVGR